MIDNLSLGLTHALLLLAAFLLLRRPDLDREPGPADAADAADAAEPRDRKRRWGKPDA